MATVDASPCDLELHAHGLLHARCNWYVSQHDYESAVWHAERMACTLREQIRLATERALAAQAEAMAEAAAAARAPRDAVGAVAAAASESLDTSTLLSLSQALEGVQHLLATAQYHWQNARRRGANGGSGGASAAYQLLRDSHTFSEQNQFLFALACLDLQRYAEAEQVLLAHALPNPEAAAAAAVAAAAGGPDLSAAPDVLPPMGSQGLLLLGRICHASSRREEAAAYYRRALQADRLCYAAYSGLCALGALDSSTIGSDLFRVDPQDIAANAAHAQLPTGPSAALSMQPQQQQQQQQQSQQQQLRPSAQQTLMLSPERVRRGAGSNAHLLATPASAMVPHMNTLSLGGRGSTAPTPRQALFTTPLTRTGSGSGAGGPPQSSTTAVAPTPASPSPSPSFVTPPPHGSPMRGARGGQAFASPPAAARPRVRGHVRAHSAAATPMYSSFSSSSSSSAAGASAAASAAAAGTASARIRKVASRLNWESDSKSARGAGAGAGPSASAGVASEYSSDDAGPSTERERNEKKVGRRINRGQTPGEKQPKTPRLDRTNDAPTTPRRTVRDVNAALLTARKATPSNRRPTASGGAGAGVGAALAPSKKRLPEIAESATPDTSADQSGIGASFTPAASSAGGTNLLHSLQTPSSFATPAAASSSGVVPAPRHLRSRSHASALGVVGVGSLLDSSAFMGPAEGALLEHDDELMGEGFDAADGAQEDELDEEEEGGGADGSDAERDEERDALLAAQIALEQQRQQELELQTAAAAHLTTLFQTMCEGYRLQSLYECKSSLSTYSTLPAPHFYSHFVHASMARAHFELHDYARCVELYAAAREMNPGRENLAGMEYYSSALWQRNQATELSALALTLSEQDPSAPETAMVVGNCFSLQRAHDSALKFFRRAIQSNPRLSYAYTLSAHEYVANEELESALRGYRLAIGVDPRSYAAWYGLGNLYLRQEKLPEAIYHFKQALALHPSSSVLHTCHGMALQAAREWPAALAAFRRAQDLDPQNPLAQYHIAHVLLATGEVDAALQLLHLLREVVPREANVHLLLGRALKRSGDLHAAMRSFVTALELDPKDRTAIKAAIEHVHANDEFDEDEEEMGL